MTLLETYQQRLLGKNGFIKLPRVLVLRADATLVKAALLPNVEMLPLGGARDARGGVQRPSSFEVVHLAASEVN